MGEEVESWARGMAQMPPIPMETVGTNYGVVVAGSAYEERMRRLLESAVGFTTTSEGEAVIVTREWKRDGSCRVIDRSRGIVQMTLPYGRGATPIFAFKDVGSSEQRRVMWQASLQAYPDEKWPAATEWTAEAWAEKNVVREQGPPRCQNPECPFCRFVSGL
jgi:hypothetical protein